MLRRFCCLFVALALLAAPALAIDREEKTPRFDLVDRLVVAFLNLWEKAGGLSEPFGQPATQSPNSQPDDSDATTQLNGSEATPETADQNS